MRVLRVSRPAAILLAVLASLASLAALAALAASSAAAEGVRIVPPKAGTTYTFVCGRASVNSRIEVSDGQQVVIVSETIGFSNRGSKRTYRPDLYVPGFVTEVFGQRDGRTWVYTRSADDVAKLAAALRRLEPGTTKTAVELNHGIGRAWEQLDIGPAEKRQTPTYGEIDVVPIFYSYINQTGWVRKNESFYSEKIGFYVETTVVVGATNRRIKCDLTAFSAK